METLGSRIRELRIKAKMSQADLAFDMEGGTTTISNYENGQREPSYSSIVKLAKALSDVHGDVLYYLITGQHPTNELLAEQLASQHVKRDQLLDNLEDFFKVNIDKRNMRLSGRINPRKFAAMFVADKYGKVDE